MRSRLLILPGLLILMGAGCSTAPSVPTATPTPSVAVAPSQCDHAYYPMKPGSSVTYKTKFGNTDGEYTAFVKSNTEGKATLEYTFKGVDGTLTQDVICDQSGTLAAQGYLDLASAITGAKLKIETKAVKGVFLPTDLKLGSEWISAYDIDVTPEGNEVLESLGITTINQQVTISRKAIAEESVTVAAGTYDALKVQSTVRIDATLTGSSPMDAISIQGTEWWVKGIGQIKSESTFNGVSTVVEAKTVTP